MASFPTSVKTFTTKSAGQTIGSAHVNDLQDEVNAIESGYLTGTARLNSSNSTLANLNVSGNSTLSVLAVANTATFSSNVTISGNLNASGNSTFNNVIVAGTASISGNSSLTGNLNVSGGSSFGGDISVSNGINISSVAHFTEVSTVAAAAANGARLYCRDNGAGKTQLMVIFQSGAGQQIAIEP